MNSLDDSMLYNYEDELRMGATLREKQKASLDQKDNNNPESADQNMSLRQTMALARLKENAKNKIKKDVTAPAKLATRQALRWAWTTLIPSWGLSLIYINMHVFLRWIFPDLFCKLGEEWQPKIVGEHSSKNVAGTAFGIIEVIGLLMIDLIILFTILTILSLIAMIMGWIQHPLDAISKLGWGAIKVLTNLFSKLL